MRQRSIASNNNLISSRWQTRIILIRGCTWYTDMLVITTLPLDWNQPVPPCKNYAQIFLLLLPPFPWKKARAFCLTDLTTCWQEPASIVEYQAYQNVFDPNSVAEFTLRFLTCYFSTQGLFFTLLVQIHLFSRMGSKIW